jgi:7,8-dihydropterin-6-yl-methyl-4-(beta-D-ribofuranosyl)aminobenzene 5'-phosphate synthase
MNREIIEHFDRTWKSFDEWFESHQALYQSELAALKMAVASGTGLEIGVGTGRFAAPLGVRFGLDPAINMLRVAKKRGILAVQGLGESLPFKKESFDFIQIVFVLEFVDYLCHFLNEAAVALKKRGALILGFIDKDSEWGRYYAADPSHRVHFHPPPRGAEERIWGGRIRCLQGHQSPMNHQPDLRCIVVYDNNPCDRKLKTDWGFSCLVEGMEKSILFDTGADGRILLSNMEKLGIRPEDINAVVLSHAHRDHTGGLEDLLARNSKIEVWLPDFFSSDFKGQAREKGAEVVEVTASRRICEGASTSGVIEGWIKEQSLVLDTRKGLVLVTGCAHPRIAHIVARVQEIFQKDIFMALGGFHLAGLDEKYIKEIILSFRESGIRKVGPAHCSGDEARRLFGEEYRDEFIEIGAGKRIQIQ